MQVNRMMPTMRRMTKFLLTVMMVLIVGSSLAAVNDSRQSTSKATSQIKVDTANLQNQMHDLGVRRRMSSSAFPVQMQVSGRSVRVVSDHNQILPIYTHSGAFYMAMRLTKGTNWLTGLPRGRYFINNRPIRIN